MATNFTLMPHQEVMKDFIVTRPFCGIWLDVGGAKSLTTLAALSEIRPTGHILVVAPHAIARSAWIQEIEKWGFPLRTQSLVVDDNDKPLTKERRLEIMSQIHTALPTMYFINEEMLTQASRGKTALSAVEGAPVPLGLTSEAVRTLAMLQTTGPMPKIDFVEHLRSSRDVAPPKSHVDAWLKELRAAGLVENVTLTCPHCTDKTGKPRGCTECQTGLIDQMPTKRYGGKKQAIWPFPTVIIDESQDFKNPRSERFKALKRMRPAITRLIELTGTPSPQDLMDVWAQMYLLDEGLALGERFTTFRETYFKPTKYMNGRPIEWELHPGAEQAIHDRIRHLVLSTDNLSIPMPDVYGPDFLEIELDTDLMKAYRRFKREQVFELATPDPNNPDTMVITADNAAILRGKLLQFASGTLYTGDNHDKDFTVIHDAKLRRLGAIAHTVVAKGETLLVPFRYRSDAALIPQYLASIGIDAQIFDGSRAMQDTWNAKKIPVMLIQPASFGRGLNIQAGGHHMLWYTLPDSSEHWTQTIGRLKRIGQPSDWIWVGALVVTGTEDAKSPDRLTRKLKTQQSLIDAVRADIRDDLADLNAAVAPAIH